jgi:hypothetical protein
VTPPARADLALAALLLRNTAEQGHSIGLGPDACASLARVADYLSMLAASTPRSDPPPS